MVLLWEDTRTCGRIVETTGPRMFGLEESEVQERRRYVAYVRKEVEVRSLSFLGDVLTDYDLPASLEHESRGLEELGNSCRLTEPPDIRHTWSTT